MEIFVVCRYISYTAVVLLKCCYEIGEDNLFQASNFNSTYGLNQVRISRRGSRDPMPNNLMGFYDNYSLRLLRLWTSFIVMLCPVLKNSVYYPITALHCREQPKIGLQEKRQTGSRKSFASGVQIRWVVPHPCLHVRPLPLLSPLSPYQSPTTQWPML